MDTPTGSARATAIFARGGLNATKATPHVLLLGGFSIVPCVSWRNIFAAKLGKLRMIYAKAEEEKKRRARERRAEEAALSENNSAAGAALSSQSKRASASRDSGSGPAGMPLSALGRYAAAAADADEFEALSAIVTAATGNWVSVWVPRMSRERLLRPIVTNELPSTFGVPAIRQKKAALLVDLSCVLDFRILHVARPPRILTQVGPVNEHNCSCALTTAC